MRTKITYIPEAGDAVRVVKSDGTESMWNIRYIRSSCDGWEDAVIANGNEEDYISFSDLNWDVSAAHWILEVE